MTQQTIGTGTTDNDGTGDPFKTAMTKANANFTELYALVVGLLKFQGNIDCSANPNYPSASKGDSYLVSVAGKIGGASGKSVDIGDFIIASANNAGGTQASVGTSWFILEHNLVGALLAANNLSDLASPSTARTNLGLAIGTDVQAFSAAIAAIAALSPSNDDILQRKAGAWTNRTLAQIKADLGLPASADVQIFTGSGTWTKPAFGSLTRVIAFAGGGGGGNGAVVAASTAASGGGGGGAGMVRDYVVSTSSLGSTETVTVGAAGTAGVAGGNSSFGAWVTAYGGGAGSAGASASASGGGGSGGFAGAGGNASGATGGAAGLIGGAAGGSGAAGSGSNLTTGAGGGSSATGSSFIGGAGGLTAASGGSGGGSGGGLTAANGTNNGAAGGPHRLAPTGAAGGTAPGGAGASNGAAPAGLTDSGAGGGGGASATAANGGNGGAGQSPGGGGGGGGSTQTGFTAGTGGTGGAGKIIVITL